MTRAAIPQPTRLEKAARISTAYLPVQEDDPLAAAKGVAVGVAIMIPVYVLLFWWLWL